MVKIKICGLYRLCDAEYVNNALPDFAGFVFYPKSHRFVSDEAAETLRSRINPQIRTVGVFVDDSPEHIAKLYDNRTVDIIQLHGREDNAFIEKLRSIIPGAEIWKAFKIRDEKDIAAAELSAADCVLLDNGFGTGKCFDWSLICGFSRRFILAGGLDPENVRDAVLKLSPWAVDMSSGVETEKIKDFDKIKAAVDAVRSVQPRQ